MAPPRKTLYLLRHAEAEPAAASGDHDRTLTPAGRQAAGRLGRFMAGQGMGIDYVLSSDALRARETLDAVAAAWPAAPPTVIDPAVYAADRQALLTRIRDVGDAAALLVVGHNPAIAELARALVGSGPPGTAARLNASLPPAGLAIFAVRCAAWSDLRANCTALTRVVLPGDLPGR